VPTVRNAAATGPYFHNGVFRTLEQVIDFYNRGGGEGIGARVANQTLPLTRLHLTTPEQHDLLAFLRSLDTM
jgi:cytochrome c peroxidase